MRKSFTRLLGLLMLFCVMSFQVVAQTAPIVTGLSPVDEFRNVRPGANGTTFTITFDQPVLPGNIGGVNSGVVSLNSKTGVQLDPIQIKSGTSVSPTTGSTVVINGNVVEITFKTQLLEEDWYFITVSTDAFKNANDQYFAGIKANPGAAFAVAGAFDWEFFVGDFTAPKVLVTGGVKQLMPRDQAQSVAIGSPLTVTFDEKVIKGAGKIGIYTADGNVVEMIDVTSANVVLNPADTVATITPTVPFLELKEYYVRIEEGAFTDDVSAYGITAVANKFAGINTNTGWNFLIDDVTAPTVAFEPTSNTTVIGKNQVFKIKLADNRAGVKFDPKETNQTLGFELRKSNVIVAPATEPAKYAVGDNMAAVVGATVTGGVAGSGTAGTWSFTYSAINEVTVAYSGNLPTGATVTINVVAGAMYDEEGNQVAATSKSWNTGDFTAPTVNLALTGVARKSNTTTAVEYTVTTDDVTGNAQNTAVATAPSVAAGSYPTVVKYVVYKASAPAATAAVVAADGVVMPLKSGVGNNNVHVFPQTGLDSKTDYVLYYTVTDAAGNTSGVLSQAFKTADIDAPTYTVAYAFDANNVETTKVDKSGVITITFNEAVYADNAGTVFTPATLATAIKLLEADGTTTPAFVASIDGTNKIVTITPAAVGYGAWKSGMTYSLKFENSKVYDYPQMDAFYAGDLLGTWGNAKAISNDPVKNFTVEDYEGPIATFAPANGDGVASSTSVSVNTPITVTFNEPVYTQNGVALNNDINSPAWVGNYVFLRLGANNTSPLITNTASNISIDATGKKVTFAPVYPLNSEAAYYVHVSSLVEDVLGYAISMYEDNATSIPSTQIWAAWQTGDNIKPVVAIDVLDAAYASLGTVEVVAPAYIQLSVSEGSYYNSVPVANYVTDNNMYRPQITLREGGVNGPVVEFNIHSVVAAVDDPLTFGDNTVIRIVPIGGFKSGVTYYVAMSQLTDSNGNTFAANQTSGTFSTKDITLPAATTFFPNDVEGVALNTQLKITFDKPIYQGTFVNGQQFVYVYNSTTSALVHTIDITLGAVTINGNVVTINLPAALGANTTYYVATTTGTPTSGAFKDGNNNFFAGISTANLGIGNNVWEFTTVDQTAPTLTAITPANTAVGIASNFKINLTFSEPIEVGTGIISIHTTLGASTGLTQVNVQSPSVTRVTGTDNQIVIDPGVNFAYGTIISLEIPNTAFKDKAPVANNYAGITGVGTHSFTVGANPVPSITAFSPLDNSNSAPLTEPFRITFSEPMKLSTTPGRINIWDNTGAAVSVQTIDLATDSHMLTWEQDGKVAVIAHLPLVMNKTYEVIVDANTFVDKETGTQVFAQAISDVANYPDANGWSFTTADLTAPTATWSPVGTALVAQNSTFTITFNEAVTKVGGTVLTNANAATMFTLSSVTPGAAIPAFTTVVNGNTITLTFAANLTSLANYTLQLNANQVQDKATTPNALLAAVPVSFQVEDKTAPAFTVFADAAVYDNVKTNLTFTLNEPVVGPNTNSMVYVYAVPFGSTAPTVDQVIANGQSVVYANGSGAKALTYTGLSNYTNYSFYAAAVDGYNNKIAAVAGPVNIWTMDKVKPQLVSLSPADNLTQVDPRAPFTLTLEFDENVLWKNPALNPNVGLPSGSPTGNYYGITLRNKVTQERIPVSNVTVAGKKISVTTVAALAEKTEYYVELDYDVITDNPVSATAGFAPNTFAEAFIGKDRWNFTTGDVSGLNLEVYTAGVNIGKDKLTPIDQSTKVNLLATDNLVLDFDEPVAKGTGIIYIYRADNTQSPLEWFDVAGTDVYVDPTDATKVIINRHNNYASGVEYFVVVPGTAFKDLANTVNENGTVIGANFFAGLNTVTAPGGAPMKTVGDWSFTATDVVVPVVSFTSFVSNPAVFPASDGLARTAALYGTPVAPVTDRTIFATFTEALYNGSPLTAITTGTDLKASFSIKETVAGTAYSTFTATYDAVTKVVTIIPDGTKPFKSNTQYTVSLNANAVKDAEGNSVPTASFNFTTWDETSPLVTFVPADTNKDVALNAKVTVEFSKPVVIAVGAKANMSLDVADLQSGLYVQLIDVTGGNVAVPFTAAILEADKKFELTPNAAFLPSNGATLRQYKVAVTNSNLKDKVYSPHGNLFNVGVDNDAFFTTIDTQAPVMTALNPLDNSTVTNLTAPLTMTFNEQVVAGTGNIQIRRANGQLFASVPVASCTFSTVAPWTVTIPHLAFEMFTGYYVVVPNGTIVDKALVPNSYAGFTDNTTWNFTTDDGLAPYVVTYEPAQNANNIPVYSNLVLTFNENINLNGGKLVIYHNNGDNPIVDDGNTMEIIPLVAGGLKVQVSGSDAVNGKTSNVITIDPSTVFNKMGTYYVRIANGAVQDIAGNNYAGIGNNTTWRFTTTDNTIPNLLSVTPVKATQNVALDTKLTMTFDRDVLKGTGYVKVFEYIYNTTTFGVEEKLAFKDIPGFENGISINSDLVSIEGKVVTVELPAKLRDNINYYYVLVDATAITNTASSKDPFAGVTNPFDWTFTTIADTDVPVLATTLVDAVSPINVNCLDKGALTLTMYFNEPVMAGEGNIVIKKVEGNVVAETIAATDGAYTNDETTGIYSAAFTPASLSDLTQYYVVVENNAIKDRSTASVGDIPNVTVPGNYFDGSSIAAGDWKFETGDVEAPVLDLTKSTPSGDNVVDVDQIVLTFDEVVIPVATGVTAGKVIVTEVGATAPFFSAVITESMIANNVVTIPVGKSFDNSTDYVVTVEANSVTDTPGDCETVRGNIAYTWNFSTDAAPYVTAEPLSSSAAIDTFEVVLTFSEAVANVDATTVLVAGGSIVNDTIVDNLDNTYTLMLTGNDGDTIVVTFDESIVDARGNKLLPATFEYVVGDNAAPKLVTKLPNTELGGFDNLALEMTFDDVVEGVAGKKVMVYEVGVVAPVATIDAAAFATEDGLYFVAPLTLTGNGDFFVTVETGAFVDKTATTLGKNFAGIADNTTWTFSVKDMVFCTDNITFAPVDGTSNLPVQGVELKITFCEPVELSNNFVVYIAESSDNTERFSVTTGTLSADGLTLTMKITETLGSATTYAVTVPYGAVTDKAGNPWIGIVDANQWNFTTGDVVAPTVVATPGTGENLPNTFKVSLKFSENVTVPTGAITASAGTVSVAGSGSEYEVTITNATDNATVTLSLGNTIVDAAGNKLTATTFTYNVGDNTAPTATALSPTGNTENANVVLTMTFNEDVVKGTGKLQIFDGSVVAKEFNVTEAAVVVNGKTVSITLPASLKKFTNYFVMVDAGFVKDAAGNNFAGISSPLTWKFTTGDYKTSVDDLAKSIKVYPTVFENFIRVEASTDVVLTKAVITNIAGQMVKEVVDFDNTIPTSDLRSGVYFISLHTADGIAKTERIIKR